MHELYDFVRGPLAWTAFFIFIAGSLYRIIKMLIMIKKKESFIFTFWSWKYSLRSIIHWMIPFRPVNMRKHPFMTIVTFVFHICLIIVPLFLFSHNLLWDESWNISCWSIPDPIADIMTIIVVFCTVFFLVRRFKEPEVRFLSTASDYFLLAIVALPFVTGFIAYHQWSSYQFWLILHILAGEIMLMAIPFTRLSHMLFAPFTRGYAGSEFGGVCHSRDW